MLTCRHALRVRALIADGKQLQKPAQGPETGTQKPDAGFGFALAGSLRLPRSGWGGKLPLRLTAHVSAVEAEPECDRRVFALTMTWQWQWHASQYMYQLCTLAV